MKIYNEVIEEENIFPSMDTTENIKPFNLMGVKLSVLNEFIIICGGEQNLQNLTTTEVCNLHMKPLTSQQSCSYCDYLISQGDQRVQQANVFISHGKSKVTPLQTTKFTHSMGLQISQCCGCDPESFQ